MLTRKIVYFEEGGAEHTDVLIDIVREAAIELGVKKIVVASTSGDSARARSDAEYMKRRAAQAASQ